MKLVVQYPQLAFLCLDKASHGRGSNPESGESWKCGSGEDSDNDRIKIGKLRFGPVELYEPLSFITMDAKRFVDIYSLSFIFGARDERAFNEMSSVLEEKVAGLDLDGKKYKFSPCTCNGSGHIYLSGDENRPALVSIMEAGEKKELRVMGIGDFGSKSKMFDELDFSEDVMLISAFANAYVNACYENLVRLKRLPEVPKETLYLNL